MSVVIFTDQEQKILELYRYPSASGLGRLTRLSVQYLVSAGIFSILAIAYSPWCALGAYLTFIAFVIIRVLGASRITGVMPGILEKYKRRIAELEGEIRASAVTPSTTCRSELSRPE